MDIGKIIERRRKSLGLTLEHVGNAVGVGKSTVKKWESGFIANMKRDKIAALAEVLRMSPADFIDTPDPLTHPGIYRPKMYKVPLLGQTACGEPIYSPDFDNGYALINCDIKADFALEAKGDSMIKAHIKDGDVVFFVSQPMVDNGQIAAVSVDNEVTLKKVFYYPEKKKLVLHAENDEFESLVYLGDELENVRILGKAVAHMRRL